MAPKSSVLFGVSDSRILLITGRSQVRVLEGPPSLAIHGGRSMIEGGCQCGKVRYAAGGQISDLSHCHCSMCRKVHGAAYVTWAAVQRNKFQWSEGDAGVKVYRSSETIDRYFCGNCGSQLMCIFKPERDLVYLTMGTVDGNPDCPPAYHQFVGSKAEIGTPAIIFGRSPESGNGP